MAALPAFFGLVFVAVVTGQTVDIEPRRAVRRVGDDVEVLCKVNYRIDSCRMTVGGTSYRLRPEIQDGDIVYKGAGLDQGECGAHIKRIKEDWNGAVICGLPPQTGSIEPTATMELVVAHAPLPPVLLAPQQVFRAGDTLSAQCIVANGRPPATITWFLDEEPITQGLSQPENEIVPGGDLVTVRQNITRRMAPEDDARRLVCRATHDAFTQPQDAATQLQVHYPPRRVDGESNELKIFGLQLGTEGRLNVTLASNPAPNVHWTVDGRPVPREGDQLTALDPLPIARGVYNVTLVVRRVSREDVGRAYLLRAENALGRLEVALRLSTLPEPAGVELDTGAIVGVVVAVLALLAAIVLVVFAKVTGRWCFADRDGDHGKTSGESSDTESAAGGGLRSGVGGLRARLTAALRRDKVTAPAATHQPLAEEKKGVVYADLALSEPTTRAAPPPATAEYAEIVCGPRPDDTTHQ